MTTKLNKRKKVSLSRYNVQICFKLMRTVTKLKGEKSL